VDTIPPVVKQNTKQRSQLKIKTTCASANYIICTSTDKLMLQSEKMQSEKCGENILDGPSRACFSQIILNFLNLEQELSKQINTEPPAT